MNGIDDSSGGQGFGLAWRTEYPGLLCVAAGRGSSKQLLSVDIIVNFSLGCVTEIPCERD